MEGGGTWKRFATNRSAAGVLALVLAALLGLATVLAEPPYSVPDHGDFYRVGGPAGVVAPPSAPPGAAASEKSPYYELRPPSFDRTTTSATVVAVAARAATFVGSAPSGLLDLRQVGFVHAVLLLAMVGVAVACGFPPVLAAGLVLCVLDPARVAYLNSLLTESAALVGVTGVAACLAALEAEPRGGRRLAVLVTLGFSALFAGFARAPAAVVPVTVVGVLALGRAAGPWPKAPRAGLVVAGLVLACAAPVAYFVRGDVARFQEINAYHRVFLGVAAASPSPRATLTRLGVDERWHGRVGTSFFDAPVPPELSRDLRRISTASVAIAWFAEPAAWVRAAERVTDSLARERPPRREGIDHASLLRVSGLHTGAFGAFPPLVWLAVLGAVALSWARRRCVRPACFLALTMVGQVVLAVLGDGFFASGRHLAVARLAVDELVLVVLLDLALEAFERRGAILGGAP